MEKVFVQFEKTYNLAADGGWIICKKIIKIFASEEDAKILKEKGYFIEEYPVEE